MIDVADNAQQPHDGAHAPSVLTCPSLAYAATCTLKASGLAKKLGRKKRIVLLWASSGCPHYQGQYRGQPCLFFNEGDVRAWLRAQGLDENKADVRDEGGAPAAAGPPPAASGATDFKSWYEEELKKRAAELMGEVDHDGAIGRAQLHLQELLSTKPPPGADVGWGRQWAGEFVKVSAELRAMDEERWSARRRRGEVIERRVAVRFAAAVAADFAGELDGLAAELAREISGRLGDVIPADRLDASRRLIQAAVREKTDAVRAKRAAAVREWVAGIGGDAPQAVAA